jgi:hypothetical protein
MAVVLTDRGEFEVAAKGGLRVSPEDAEEITGWTLKPEGMCREELCVPLGDEARRDGDVDIAAFWRTLGHPIVSDTCSAYQTRKPHPTPHRPCALAGRRTTARVGPNDFSPPTASTVSLPRARNALLSMASWSKAANWLKPACIEPGRAYNLT